MANNQITHTVSFVTIDESSDGQRIDNFLLKQWKGVPKSHIYRVLRKGEVRINKKRAKPETKLAIGDEVRMPPITLDLFLKPTPTTDVQQCLQSNIIYEDDLMIVLNKPSGIAVHGGSGLSYGVIEALRELYPKGHYLELVHRIDRDTSGILLIAKRRSHLRRLHELLRNREIKKEYVCLVKGHWQVIEERVEDRLQKQQLPNGDRIVVLDNEGMKATTEFTTIESFEKCSLMRAMPISGRTHQIRVHAQSCGHELAGDDKYADAAFNQLMRKAGLKRLFLHAERITYQDPVTEKIMRFEAPLPDDLKALVNTVKSW